MFANDPARRLGILLAAVHEAVTGPSRHFGKMQNLVAIGA